ncbi:signal transduction histidine kinase [Curtobacterium luteum]|uniref:histidine kinase n=1 Tax=Curtobacterium luteum TaxID=33881 RepID=A0ABS2RTI5_9MICO|nr:HAMP domain-containing sensor histidine kinase [Curtobacterium luteum]MBM7801466.1 signal transduction histidine kinase [Curtobacterium luteum]NUU50035.1 HAMP domain-containing histidine kinase [Curtobacterium luteum]
MRVLRRLSIRTRITLGSLLVGAVVLVGTALVLHLQIERATIETDRSLAERDAAPFVADLRSNPGESPDRPSQGVLVGVRDAAGAWTVDALPHELRDRLPDTVRDETTLRLRDHRGVVTVVGVPVTTSAGSFVVWAAQDGRGGHETLERVDRSLVVGTVLALAAFGGTAWLLTTLALRPVGRMRRTAEAISTGTAAGHLPIGRSDDELAGLARTLNAFLDRQREHAERERRMVSDASHELRTPLAALTARLELAHRSSGDAAALERELTAAESDAARLVALANTLLELSRLDEDTPVPSTPARDLVSELMASVDRARAIDVVGPRDVDFSVDVGDPDARYDVAPAAFARVVDNLVANAIAAGSDGGVVRATLRQDDTRALELAVTDDGPGVPEAFLPQAFDRFTRADESRTTLGGSGLGLALVRGIAERGGGTATLANRDGGGAVATVRFPAR